MDLFRTVVDGPYALLLILQILVVAGLLLTLIWLFIYRAKEADFTDFTGMATDGAGAHLPPSTPASLPQPVTIIDAPDKPVILAPTTDGLMDLTGATLGNFGESSPAMGLLTTEGPKTAPQAQAQSPAPGDGFYKIESNPGLNPKSEVAPKADAIDVNTRPDQSRVDAELLHNARAESDELRSKLEYLEGKLLEYEIVQEEIANLSALKMENEKLREEVVQMQRGGKRPAGNQSGGPTSGGAPTPSPTTAEAEAPKPIDVTTAAPVHRDTTVIMPDSLKSIVGEVAFEASATAASDSNEPTLSAGTEGRVTTEYPPEPLPNNVLQLPLGDKEPSLGKVKEVAEAFQDPMINNQLEKILSKLEQLTTK